MWWSIIWQLSNLGYTKSRSEKERSWIWKAFYQGNYVQFVLNRIRNEFHLRMCFQKAYSTLFHGSGAIEKARPSTVSLEILNMILPIIVWTHICFPPINGISWSNGNSHICLMRNENKDLPRFCSFSCPPFTEKGKMSWCLYWILFGTDGARTRSFRLDRAVLWPIELQSQGNKAYSIHILMISFKPFRFRIAML